MDHLERQELKYDIEGIVEPLIKHIAYNGRRFEVAVVGQDLTVLMDKVMDLVSKRLAM